MDFPEDLKYSKEHEWARPHNDGLVVGITDYAQDSLGEIVYVELPEEGSRVVRGEAFGVVESTKAVSDLYAPVSGTVLEVNEKLVDEQACAIVNSDPLGQGWLFIIEMSNPKEIEELLTRAEYEHYLESG